MEISTHALTWSATNDAPLKSKFLVISTHALTWSATRTIGVSPYK